MIEYDIRNWEKIDYKNKNKFSKFELEEAVLRKEIAEDWRYAHWFNKFVEGVPISILMLQYQIILDNDRKIEQEEGVVHGTYHIIHNIIDYARGEG